MTAVGDGATLEGSPLPTRSVSKPPDRLSQEPAALGPRRDPGRGALPARGCGRARAGRADQEPYRLVGPRASTSGRGRSPRRSPPGRLTLGLALVALAFGIGLGALHAFAPGHGKTRDGRVPRR